MIRVFDANERIIGHHKNLSIILMDTLMILMAHMVINVGMAWLNFVKM